MANGHFAWHPGLSGLCRQYIAFLFLTGKKIRCPLSSVFINSTFAHHNDATRFTEFSQ